jgi:hypothetical protein
MLSPLWSRYSAPLRITVLLFALLVLIIQFCYCRLASMTVYDHAVIVFQSLANDDRTRVLRTVETVSWSVYVPLATVIVVLSAIHVVDLFMTRRQHSTPNTALQPRGRGERDASGASTSSERID